jgi:hypothetical protein
MIITIATAIGYAVIFIIGMALLVFLGWYLKELLAYPFDKEELLSTAQKNWEKVEEGMRIRYCKDMEQHIRQHHTPTTSDLIVHDNLSWCMTEIGRLKEEVRILKESKPDKKKGTKQ